MQDSGSKLTAEFQVWTEDGAWYWQFLVPGTDDFYAGSATTKEQAQWDAVETIEAHYGGLN